MWEFNQKFDKRVFHGVNTQKMTIGGLLLFLIFAFSAFVPHPYHVSYTEIEYKPQQHRVTFSIEVFTDDLEKAINLEFKPEKFFLGQDELSEETETLIQKYVAQKLSVIIDGIIIKSPQYLPSQSTPDRTTIFFEYTDLPEFSSFAVHFQLLNHLYKGQQNIIEFKSPQLTGKELLTIEKNNATWILKD